MRAAGSPRDFLFFFRFRCSTGYRCGGAEQSPPHVRFSETVQPMRCSPQYPLLILRGEKWNQLFYDHEFGAEDQTHRTAGVSTVRRRGTADLSSLKGYGGTSAHTRSDTSPGPSAVRRTRDVDHRHMPRLRNPARSQEQVKRSAQLFGFLPKRIANRIV